MTPNLDVGCLSSVPPVLNRVLWCLGLNKRQSVLAEDPDLCLSRTSVGVSSLPTTLGPYYSTDGFHSLPSSVSKRGPKFRVVGHPFVWLFQFLVVVLLSPAGSRCGTSPGTHSRRNCDRNCRDPASVTRSGLLLRLESRQGVYGSQCADPTVGVSTEKLEENSLLNGSSSPLVSSVVRGTS